MPEAKYKTALRLKSQGLTLHTINRILGIGKKEERTEEPKENRYYKREFFTRRFKYICQRCRRIFQSRLLENDAICLFCGSEKILKY